MLDITHQDSFNLHRKVERYDYDDDAPEPNQRIGFKMNFEAEKK
jgi:hypothetical protein